MKHYILQCRMIMFMKGKFNIFNMLKTSTASLIHLQVREDYACSLIFVCLESAPNAFQWEGKQELSKTIF